LLALHNSDMIRKKILAQYSIVSLVMILIVSGLHCFIFSRNNTDHLITMHIGLFTDIINQYVEDNPVIHSFFISTNRNENAQKRASAIKLFANMLQKKNGIFGVKLLNSRNQVVWDDTGRIVDKEFRSHDEYIKALNGVAAYIVEEPAKNGNEEIATGSILDIHIPITYLNKVIGVMEMHEPVAKLRLPLFNNFHTYWIISLIIGSVLYVSLFFIFYRANRIHSVTLDKLEQTQDVTIFALAYQAELRDSETGRHLDRTVFYVHLLAEELRKNKKYCAYITDRYIAHLVKSTPLHDIGKVGVPDSILNKPGRLTPEEFEAMKKHCDYAVMIMEKASTRLSFQSFLDIAVQLAASHHEKWDGSGYPKGLSKETIPLSGRIMALADVYDALRTNRSYKEAFPHDQCLKIIMDSSGTHFDPDVVNAFLRHEKEFLKISELLGD
jgi:response regulator RpfG family c-di-GMP phosphodiesterase